MDAIEKRAPNPNVAVIHEAMQHFPEGSWMRGALDHAAAELAVLHGRCQRAALTPPEGYVLVPVEPTEDMCGDGAESKPMRPFTPLDEMEAFEEMTGCEQARHVAKLCWAAMLAARPEVP